MFLFLPLLYIMKYLCVKYGVCLKGMSLNYSFCMHTLTDINLSIYTNEFHEILIGKV